MRNVKKIAALLLAGAMVLGACSDDSLDDAADELDEATNGSVADEVEQNAVELATEVEAEMSSLATAIQNSEAAADLETAWNDVQAELTAAIASMQTDGSIETDELEDELDEFQSAIEQASDSVEPELMDSWDSLRSKIEQMMS